MATILKQTIECVGCLFHVRVSTPKVLPKIFGLTCPKCEKLWAYAPRDIREAIMEAKIPAPPVEDAIEV